MSSVGWFVLVAVGIAAWVFFSHRATKPEPKPAPLPFDNPPIINDPLITNGDTATIFIGDPVGVDLRYRAHGCDAYGNPIGETGAYDPEGDMLEYMVTASGPGGYYVVWNEAGMRIDGRWVPNGSAAGFAIAPAGPGKPNEVQALCRFIVGWTKTETPYPFTPKGCPKPEPTPTPVDTSKVGEVIFTYSVRDTKGNEVSRSRVWSCFDNCKK